MICDGDAAAVVDRQVYPDFFLFSNSTLVSRERYVEKGRGSKTEKERERAEKVEQVCRVAERESILAQGVVREKEREWENWGGRPLASATRVVTRLFVVWRLSGPWVGLPRGAHASFRRHRVYWSDADDADPDADVVSSKERTAFGQGHSTLLSSG